MKKRGTMDEYELGCFEIAGKNYSKEELKEKVEIFLRNLIKTNECIRYGENFDPDEDRFQIPITNDTINLLVSTFNQIDLSTWERLSYYSYREPLGHDCYEILLHGINYLNRNISKKYNLTDIMIEIYTRYDKITISFKKINKKTLSSIYISLSSFNDFVKVYNELM